MARQACLLGWAAVVAGCGGAALAPSPTTVPSTPGSAGDGTLDLQLEAMRGRYRLPALTGMVFGTERILEAGVAGVRALGYPEAAGPDDEWHVGSLTKSMTSTLAAVLVERGRIAWDTTIGQVFPDLLGTMRPEYASVRLDELLTHTAGMPTDMSRAPSWVSLRTSNESLRAQRRRLTAQYLALPPESRRGTFQYSNPGYIVAGAMLEEAAGEPWESLMTRLVFAPLKMTGAGYGAPGTPGRRDQPWGHAPVGDAFRPVPPGLGADNPLAVGPAGTVHATLTDLATYFRMHLNGARGVGSLVSVASFRKLQEPAPGTDYACGWGVVEAPRADGLALEHAGSNDLWYAAVWIAPNRGFGVFAATNAGGDAASHAVEDATNLLITRFETAHPPT